MGHLRKLGNLYQTEIVRIFSLMSEEEFDRMNCLFDCKLDQYTDEPFSKKIEKTQFTEV
jgi:hypothetical protein